MCRQVLNRFLGQLTSDIQVVTAISRKVSVIETTPAKRVGAAVHPKVVRGCIPIVIEVNISLGFEAPGPTSTTIHFFLGLAIWAGHMRLNEVFF